MRHKPFNPRSAESKEEKNSRELISNFDFRFEKIENTGTLYNKHTTKIHNNLYTGKRVGQQ